MKRLFFSLFALAATTAALHADTSYLLIQAPFGAGDAIETYKWKVIYEHGSLTTGLDLMNAVFGTATDTGTTYQTKELFSAGNSTLGASYIDFGSGGSFLFTISVTINSKTLLYPTDPSWSYMVAGGSGWEEIPYSAGTWTYSNDGMQTRLLSDGSYDAWVVASWPDIAIADTTTPEDNNPVNANFTTATVVNAVPEPGTASLLLLGATGLFFRRRRP